VGAVADEVDDARLPAGGTASGRRWGNWRASSGAAMASTARLSVLGDVGGHGGKVWHQGQ
jgi:hypothetical protein